jgi:chromosome segregation ATPase
VVWGERDDELAALTERIETGLKAKYDEAERVLAREAEARKSLQDLSEGVQDRRRVLTSLEAQIMRGEGQLGAVNEKLAQLRGSIPA